MFDTTTTLNPLAETLDVIKKMHKRACVKPTKKRQNKGAVALKKWLGFDTDIEMSLIYAIERMQQSFHKTEGEYDCAGQTKLTAMLGVIGSYVSRKAGIHDPTSIAAREIEFYIGAVFITALQNCGFIKVDRDNNSHNNRAPTLIHVDPDKWNELAGVIISCLTEKGSGISLEPQPEIVSLLNKGSGMPVVKHMHDNDLFLPLLGTNFLSGLNGIQKTAWRVNHKALEAVENHKWDDVIGPIPTKGNQYRAEKALKNVEIEEKRKAKGQPNTYDKAYAIFVRESSLWAVRKNAMKERSRIQDRLMTVAKANAFKDHLEFYYSGESDHRGRIYYAESFLNFQGNDLAKGMLEFANGVILNDAGMRALKIYAACCFNQSFSMEDVKQIMWSKHDYVAYLNSNELEDISVDKMDEDDREEWSNQNIDMMREVAHNGILHPEAEKPVLFFAVCNEIANALDAHARGEPFYTHLPVGIDGQNNGAQHSAAMAKDYTTACQVGMVDTPLPVDLYVNVAKEMVKILPEWFASRGMSMKDIRKNISKRACMIRIYSAGLTSIAENMFDDCYKTGATVKYDITMKDCKLLARAAIKAIDKVCPANSILRRFLQSCVAYELGSWHYEDADGNNTKGVYKTLKVEKTQLTEARKATETGSPERMAIDVRIKAIEDEFNSHVRVLNKGNGSDQIAWTSPSGFNIASRYFLTHPLTVDVSISDRQHCINYVWETERPDMDRHARSITANVTHSLDSAHMALVITKWCALGYTSFGAVHDSFAVHANDVEHLKVVVKDAFYEMYDVPNFYETLADQILTNREGFETSTPVPSDLDLTCIHNSRYFFC